MPPNAGAQAINLAYLAGARRLILVGFDMRAREGRNHWFGEHPPHVHRTSPYPQFVQAMHSMAADLDAAGVTVLNACPDSALPYWPRMTAAQVRQLCARS